VCSAATTTMESASKFISSPKAYGVAFISCVFTVIMGIHSTYVFVVWGPRLPEVAAACILVFYHCFFINLLLSLFQCIRTDPGLVPPNWGFYMGDETKRRRYCKMCNVWKPDRTHHCSICNRCILNMDHHCPWINNCVGFYNRKFFIQLLGFVYTSIGIIVITSVPDIVERISAFSVPGSGQIETWFCVQSFLVMMMYSMCLLLVATLTNFIKFHMKLVLENYTTIENLEREEGAKSKFDIGWRRNWEQVFGHNASLWWLALHTPSSKPVGDGVRWRVHYTRVIDEEEDLQNAG